MHVGVVRAARVGRVAGLVADPVARGTHDEAGERPETRPGKATVGFPCTLPQTTVIWTEAMTDR